MSRGLADLANKNTGYSFKSEFQICSEHFFFQYQNISNIAWDLHRVKKPNLLIVYLKFRFKWNPIFLFVNCN